MEKDFFFLYQLCLSNNNHSPSIGGGGMSDRKTIINHVCSQTEKNIIKYHEEFEQAQTE